MSFKPIIAGDTDELAMTEAAADDEATITGWDLPGIDSPSFHIVLLAKAIERLSARQMASECDLSMAEWRVLSRLATRDGATVRDVAAYAWVDRAEVSRAAASLEAAGLTGRRENPQDRRSPVLFATQAGLAVYEKLIPMRAEFHLELASELEPAERAMLDYLLLKVARNVTSLSSAPRK